MASPAIGIFLQYLRGLAASQATSCLADVQLLERFVSVRHEDAFTAMVHRHGGMIFGVCRRLLRETHDAEDAFQATFLVLARKAGQVGPIIQLGKYSGVQRMGEALYPRLGKITTSRWHS